MELYKPYLVGVDTDSNHVTSYEYQHHSNQEHCNLQRIICTRHEYKPNYLQISPLSRGVSGVVSGGAVSDGDVEEEVHDGDEDEGDQHHHDEVGDQDVVSRIMVTLTNLCRTNLGS